MPAIPSNALTQHGATRIVSATTQTVTVTEAVPANTRCLLIEHSTQSRKVMSITTPHGEVASVDIERANTGGATNGASRIIGFTTLAGLATSDQITVTYDASSTDGSLALYPVPNVALRLPQDRAAYASSAGTASTTVSVTGTATTADEVAVVVVQTMTADVSISAPGEWTYLGYLDSYGSGQRNQHAFVRSIVSAGSVTFSATIPAGEWTAVMMTYRKQTNEPTSPILCSMWNGWPTSITQKVQVRTLNVAAVRLQYSVNNDFSGAVTTSAATPTPLWGYATITLTGLSQNTRYWFRAVLDGTPVTGRDGTFITAPAVGAATSFSWWQASCIYSGDTQTAAFDQIIEHNPTFGILNGDFHYVVRNDPSGDGVMTCSPESYLAGVEDQITVNAALERELRSRPVLRSLSNHDSGKANWSTAATAAQVPGVLWSFTISYPNVLPYAGSTEEVYSWGRLGFYLLDCRLMRGTDSASDGSSHTMLGTAQQARVVAWLGDGVDQNKVLVSDVQWNSPTGSNTNTWAGYDYERQVLAAAFPTRRVHIESGDTHALAYDDGTNTPGGVPSVLAAPLSNHTSSVPAGNFQAFYPLTGDESHSAQVGIATVTDRGGNLIQYDWAGYSNGSSAGVAGPDPVVEVLSFTFYRDADDTTGASLTALQNGGDGTLHGFRTPDGVLRGIRRNPS